MGPCFKKFIRSLFQKFSPQSLKNLEIAEEKPDFEDVRFSAQTPLPPASACVRF